MTQRLRDFVSGKGKRKKTLSDVGVTTIADEKTAKRIEQYKSLAETIQHATILPTKIKVRTKDASGQEVEKTITATPEVKMRLIAKNLHSINQQLNEIAIPWCRAGSEAGYLNVIHGWSGLYTQFSDMATYVMSMLKKYSQIESLDPETSKEELVRKFHTWFQTIYLRYAQLILGVSWSDKDVSQAWNLTVFQPPIPGVARVDLSGSNISEEGQSGVKHEDT